MFNQPLTLDTSSVTDMRYMFYVRSAHALRTTQPQARTSFRIVCALRSTLGRARRPSTSR